MSDQAEKVREKRLRRAADRQGLVLKKSRVRDPRALTFGTYMLVDPTANTIVVGNTQNGYGMSLDDIENALNDDAYRARRQHQADDAARARAD